jgi:adenylate cyclase
MRPHSKVTRGPAKAGSRKAQRHNSTAGRRGSAPAEEGTELAQIRRERDEALEREIAAAEVLKVISSSPGELESVFKAMLVNAMQICEANFGTLFRFAGKAFEFAAEVGTPPELAEFQKQRGPFQPAGDPLKHIMETRRVCHLWDSAKSGTGTAPARLGGARSIVGVPMLKDDALVGAITIYRTEVRPFSEKQIELLQNFAAQAVIAIENARLLNELRESLDRQTATSEVLSVISSSRGDLAPVFHAILENATRICEATFGSMVLREGDGYRRAALHNAPPQFEELNKKVPILGRGTAPSVDHAIDTGHVSHTLDAAAEEPDAPIAKYAGARTLLDVPMLKGKEAIGILGIYRQEVRPFTDRQIELVKNFAAQAVIAIENARLLNDLNKLNQQLEQRVADQVAEIERMGRLRRFLSPQVADLIVASGTEKQLESHRREITALFCDLRGFTGFSESSDPEDVMALLRDYHAAIGQIIIKYSGTLERFAGDGVMVVFNDPVPVENPALQAVLMALEMRVAIGALIEKWRDLGHDLGFGIGIAHGFATLGTIGFEGRFDYAAIGTVSNVASRLCDEAKPGQILISPRVRQAIEKAVTVEPVGEFTLKGIRRPMMAYNVLASSPAKPN